MSNLDKNDRTNYNLCRLLRAIWLTEGISRIELCKKLNMDKATASTLVSHLIKSKIVTEQKKIIDERNKPGRRPIGLAIAHNFGCVIGFEYHINGIKAVVTDMLHNTLFVKIFPYYIKGETIKKAFLEVYEEIINLPQIKDIGIIGIGVAIPGIVDRLNGIITDSWELGIIDEPYDFYKKISDKMDIPLFLENNANCCAYGILARYRATEYKYFLYVYFGFENLQDKYTDEIDHLSIGIGIVLDGKLFLGPDGSAGEFQTIKYAKTRVNQLTMTREEQISFKINPRIRTKVIEDLASHLALIVNMFNFKQVFLGGDLEFIPDETEKIIEEAINKNWAYNNDVECEINVERNHEYPAASGAAGLVLDQIFTIPDAFQEVTPSLLNRIIDLKR